MEQLKTIHSSPLRFQLQKVFAFRRGHTAQRPLERGVSPAIKRAMRLQLAFGECPRGPPASTSADSRPANLQSADQPRRNARSAQMESSPSGHDRFGGMSRSFVTRDPRPSPHPRGCRDPSLVVKNFSREVARGRRAKCAPDSRQEAPGSP